MTIYVDEFPEGWGKWSGGGHMLTTDIDELHEMACKLGLRRSWFQDKTWPHYDLTRNKRLAAIEMGAVQVELGEAPNIVLMRKENGTYEPEWKRRGMKEWMMPSKIAPQREEFLKSQLKRWEIKKVKGKLGITCPHCKGKALVSRSWAQPRTYNCRDGTKVLIIGRPCTYCFRTARIK